MPEKTTLEIWLQRKIDGGVPPELASVIATAADACAELSGILRNAPADGLTGALHSINVQGETQKQLDVVANDLFIKHCNKNHSLSVLVSEELDDFLPLDHPETGYALVFDPLDGSSNLDVNVTVGSIFSVLAVTGRTPADLLQPGTRQKAAGYAAYGPSTALVLTFGDSVAIFSLNTTSGIFELVRDGVTVSASSAEFAINTARYRFWDHATRAYVDNCVAGETGPFGKRYNMRWVGSMVADIHRILARGGVFLYPSDSETSAKGGRLRLLYEANPMAMLMEAAGAAASTGRGRLLDVQPEALHQRIAVILGSRDEVEKLEQFYRDGV